MAVVTPELANEREFMCKFDTTVTHAARTLPAPSISECPLCGTRLRPNDEPGALEVGADSLQTIARHRCAPRVRVQTR